jgi:hypothetical protein
MRQGILSMRKPRRKTVLCQAILSASLVMLAGCEWDNSDDYEQDPVFSTDPDSPGTGPETPTPTPTGPVVSGTVATSERIEDATVCLDENANGACDQGEARTTTDNQGEWTIPVPGGQSLSGPVAVVVEADPPATRLSESGTSVNWQYNLSALAVPGFDGSATGVFVSPISTLIETERQNLPDGDQDKAVENVAGALGTDVDILQNYLNPPTDSSPVEELEYKRLRRIADVANELAKDIDAQVGDSERQQISEQELNNRIFEQVDDALPQIIEDVDRSLVEQPNDGDFDADTIAGSPDYDDSRQAPDTEPSPPSLTELQSRIAGAEVTSPYFEEIGFETYPVPGAELFDMSWFKNPLIGTLNARRTELYNLQVELANENNTQPPSPPTLREDGLIYYEARRRVGISADQDALVADIQIGVPRNQDYASDDSDFHVVSETACDNGDFQCDELSSSIRTVRALSWTGFSFRTNTIQTGHGGRQRYLPLNSLGDLVANSQSTNYSSQMSFGQFSLDGLDGRPVLDELIGGEEVPGAGSFTFGPDTFGYTFEESLVSDIILSQWPAGGTGNLCDSPGMPDAGVTESCNLVYGAVGQSTGLPAETFAQALYPISQQESAYTSFLEDGKPADAIGVTGPTDDVYVARLFGSASNDEGVIRIYRQLNPGVWETIDPVGGWTRPEFAEFDRIDLNLPGGFYVTEARLGFDLGHAYLFERSGYLRHGWLVPDTVNVESLYGRKQIKYAFSRSAFDQIIADLDSLGILTEHPFYTRQLIADLDAEIADTQQALDDARNPVGGGGNTE